MENVMSDLFGGSDSDDDAGNIKICPLHSAAIEAVVTGVGGGRGLIASQDLDAGTLVMAEMPLLMWPKFDHDDPGSLKLMAEMVLSSPRAVGESLTMFPQSIDLVGTQEVDALKHHLQTHYTQLCAVFPEKEVLRVLLVLQHNGFSSGFYSKITLINHSCTPNCIKYNPSDRSGRASEIWTIKSVKQGEELCISYCVPIEQTSDSISTYLLQQHFFQCQCIRCVEREENIPPNHLIPSEDTPPSLCTTSHTMSTATTNKELETKICELELEYDMYKGEIISVISIHTEIDKWIKEHITQTNLYSSSHVLKFEQVEQLKEQFFLLEKMNNKDITTNEYQYNQHNICLITIMLHSRLLKLAINIKEYIINTVDNNANKTSMAYLSSINYKAIAQSFLMCNFLLLPKLISYCGALHPDIATVCLDIAQGLEGLLNRFPSRIQKLYSVSDMSESSVIQFVKSESCKYKLHGNSIIARYCTNQRYPTVFSLRNPGDMIWGPAPSL